MIFYQNINRNIRFTEIGNKNETEFYEVKRTMEDKKLQEALKKEEDLKAYLRQLESVAVAFSGERAEGSDPLLRKRRHPSFCM